MIFWEFFAGTAAWHCAIGRLELLDFARIESFLAVALEIFLNNSIDVLFGERATFGAKGPSDFVGEHRFECWQCLFLARLASYLVDRLFERNIHISGKAAIARRFVVSST